MKKEIAEQIAAHAAKGEWTQIEALIATEKLNAAEDKAKDVKTALHALKDASDVIAKRVILEIFPDGVASTATVKDAKTVGVKKRIPTTEEIQAAFKAKEAGTGKVSLRDLTHQIDAVSGKAKTHYNAVKKLVKGDKMPDFKYDDEKRIIIKNP